MLNFTIGPVQSGEAVRAIGAEQVPYFRTAEFSATMLENEQLVKKFSKSEEDARVIFLTASGTAAMECAVINVFSTRDKLLVVNGGSFGQRFCDICAIHDIPCTEIKLEFGQILTEDILEQYAGQGYTGFLVNIHETSTGMYYDPELIAGFCRRENLFLVVDAISSFLADPFDMAQWGVEVMITSSQKALACPPGISILVLSGKAVERIRANQVRSLYFNLKDALQDMERWQTPYTPAVGILLQINERLRDIDAAGGPEVECERTAGLAADFRNGIKGLPLTVCSASLSNAVTPLATKNCSANDIFLALKDHYGIWVCPNGGDWKDKIFRVGHIGALTKADNRVLLDALRDLAAKEILR